MSPKNRTYGQTFLLRPIGIMFEFTKLFFGIATIALAAFACSDRNNEQVTYPKPEGLAVGQWTRLADYPETAYANYTGKVIAGDEYVSWAGQGFFAECVNDVCPNGRVFNFVTNEWREMSLDGAPSARINRTPR